MVYDEDEWEEEALQLDDINLASQISCGSRLDSAFNWLFKSRQNADQNDLFWGMAQGWQRLKSTLRTALQQGNYTFKPLTTVQLPTWYAAITESDSTLLNKSYLAHRSTPSSGPDVFQ